MTHVTSPTDAFEYELYEAKQQDREERLEKARRVYPHLCDVAESVRSMQDALKQDEIAWHEQELERLKKDVEPNQATKPPL